MAISRPTRDRIIAAVGAFALVAVVFGTLFIAKSCSKTCEVTFFDGDRKIKTQSVIKGDTVKEWTPDSEDGKNFVCWVDKDGNAFDFTARIESDLSLYASWSFEEES